MALPSLEWDLIVLRDFRNERLYRLSPGVFEFLMGVNKLGHKGYSLSPRNHPRTVGISPLVIP